MGESIHTQASYPRQRPRAAPFLGQVQVVQDIPSYAPIPILYSDFDSAGYGGLGATTTVVYFPGDPPSAAWDFQEHPRAAARRKGAISGLKVPAATPQTVSNARRQELVEEALLPGEALPGKLDIFEGIG